MGVWLFEGYLLLMKKYANLPGITYIDAIEQTDRGERDARPRPSQAEVNTSETY